MLNKQSNYENQMKQNYLVNLLNKKASDLVNGYGVSGTEDDYYIIDQIIEDYVQEVTKELENELDDYFSKEIVPNLSENQKKIFDVMWFNEFVGEHIHGNFDVHAEYSCHQSFNYKDLPINNETEKEQAL